MIVKHMAKDRCGYDYVMPRTPTDDRNAKVIAGDPEACRLLLDTGCGYYSVALSYFEGETTPQRINADREKFLDILLPGFVAGLDYAYVAVRHDETEPDRHYRQRIAEHIIIVKLHLPSGKVLTPYLDRLDRPRMELWQETTNRDQGYTSPFEPCRRRALKASEKHVPKVTRNIKEEITELITESIKSGEIASREDVLTLLETHGFTIKRTTDSQITVIHPKAKMPIRLQGQLYELRGIERIIAASYSTKEERNGGILCVTQDDLDRLEKLVERKRAQLQKRFSVECSGFQDRLARRTEKGAIRINADAAGNSKDPKEANTLGRNCHGNDSTTDIGRRGPSSIFGASEGNTDSNTTIVGGGEAPQPNETRNQRSGDDTLDPAAAAKQYPRSDGKRSTVENSEPAPQPEPTGNPGNKNQPKCAVIPDRHQPHLDRDSVTHNVSNAKSKSPTSKTDEYIHIPLPPVIYAHHTETTDADSESSSEKPTRAAQSQDIGWTIFNQFLADWTRRRTHDQMDSAETAELERKMSQWCSSLRPIPVLREKIQEMLTKDCAAGNPDALELRENLLLVKDIVAEQSVIDRDADKPELEK